MRGRIGSFIGAATLTTALLLSGCGGDAGSHARASAQSPLPIPEANAPRDVAVLTLRDLGDVRIELLGDVAPKTVAHFAKLADAGYYDGTTFHRVIPEFMIQGGDPNSRDRDPRNDGLGGSDVRVEDEWSPIAHVRGIVSLANRGDPGTAGAQFFIVLEPTRPLDGRYAVFGRVVEGMDVVDRVAAAPRDLYGRHGPVDRPLEDVVIERIRIERAPASVAGSASER